MTLNPCVGCGKIKPGKPVTIYAAWNNGGERNSYRSSWCYGCAGTEFHALMRAGFDPNDDTVEQVTTCPICGGELGQDFAMTNASVYRGDQSSFRQWWTCFGCAATVREKLSAGGEPLNSRPLSRDSGEEWGRPQHSPPAGNRSGLPW